MCEGNERVGPGEVRTNTFIFHRFFPDRIFVFLALVWSHTQSVALLPFLLFFKSRKRKEAEEQLLSLSPSAQGILSGVGAPSVGAGGTAGASLALSSSSVGTSRLVTL